MKDRRKSKRFIEKNKAVIHFSGGGESFFGNPDPAWTRNISVDGARLLTHKMFPVDTRLIITLDLPRSDQVVKLWARVVWTQNTNQQGEYEVGVEFLHSLQTRHSLFKHLYGYGFKAQNTTSEKIENAIPVEVVEA